MKAIRRAGFIFFTLLVGIFLGTLGWRPALLIVSPFFILWFMMWDERKYKELKRQQQQQNYYYREYP